MIDPSELIINPNGSIYHLALRPEQLAHKIIIAGDPGRIESISQNFDTIEHKVSNREFVTHTGIYKNNRITALATGIGTDNIDIVLNEIDALVNVDLEKRIVKEKHTKLEIVRIGTCGSIQEAVPADEIVVSTHAFGLDGLMNFYDFKMNASENEIHKEILKQTNWDEKLNNPYLVEGSASLIHKIGKDYKPGITITASGFYAPQGRAIRIKPKHENINEKLRAFQFKGQQIVNYEMETSALYGLAKLMGHDACTVCAVVANRYANSFSKDYKVVMKVLIKQVLDRLVS